MSDFIQNNNNDIDNDDDDNELHLPPPFVLPAGMNSPDEFAASLGTIAVCDKFLSELLIFEICYASAGQPAPAPAGALRAACERRLAELRGVNRIEAFDEDDVDGACDRALRRLESDD